MGTCAIHCIERSSLQGHSVGSLVNLKNVRVLLMMLQTGQYTYSALDIACADQEKAVQGKEG